jgi:hypothetical protein
MIELTRDDVFKIYQNNPETIFYVIYNKKNKIYHEKFFYFALAGDAGGPNIYYMFNKIGLRNPYDNYHELINVNDAQVFISEKPQIEKNRQHRLKIK